MNRIIEHIHNLPHDYTLLDKYLNFGGIFFVLFLLVVAAVLIDLWDGLSTARKLGQPIMSHATRKTGLKIQEYARVLILGITVDLIGGFVSVWHLPYISMIFAFLLVCVEIKSLFEHAARRKSRLTEMNKVAQDLIDAAKEKDEKRIIALATKLLTGFKEEKEEKEKESQTAKNEKQ